MMRRALPHLLVYGLYLLVVGWLTWPLAGQLSTHLAGFEYGDSREMARHIWWYNTALRSGQDPIFQPNMAYPDGLPGGVLLWANPQQWFPAWLLAYVVTPVTAFNLAALLYMALNGWAAYLLGLYLFDNRHAPALITGLVFMAAPTFQTHLAGGHGGLMVAWPAPLYAWALLRLVDQPRWRDFGLAVLCFVLAPGGHLLQVIYLVLPISAALAGWRLWRRDWRGAGLIAAVSISGGLLLALYLLPVYGEIFGTAAYTEEGGFTRYSADLLSVVSPSFDHPLWGGLDYPRRVLGINLEEGTSHIGLMAGGLALAGVMARRAARPWLLLALMAWVLSLGPLLKMLDQPLIIQADGYETGITLPWAFLQHVPGLSLARTPGRFNFALALAVAALAGYGVRALWDAAAARRRGRWAVVLALAALILLDYRMFWPFPTTPAAVPQAVRALTARDDIRAVLDVPWENTVAAKAGLYLQTAHQQPLIAGHVTRSTPVDPAMLTVLQDTLDPALLDLAGADVVIVHKQYAAPHTLALARQRLGEPYYEDGQIAVFEVPPPQTGPAYSAPAQPFTGAVRDQQDLYLYAPAGGWLDVTGTLAAEGRMVALRLDGEVVGRWWVDGEQAVAVPLPLTGGYHTLTLALEPPCPVHHGPALRCRAAAVSDLRYASLAAFDLMAQNVRFEHGITLDYALPASSADDDMARVFWRFEQPPPPNAIRFVHVVDAGGVIAWQDDQPLDTRGALVWGESLVPGAGLPAGDYDIYVGWYTYPDLIRYAVLSDVEGAAEDRVHLGRIRFTQP